MRPGLPPSNELVAGDRERLADLVAAGSLITRDFGMRAATAPARKQMRAEAGADSLARWHRRVRSVKVRSHPRTLAPVAALAPPQKPDSIGDRQVSDPHYRPVLNRHRCPATPAAAGRLDEQLDLGLELPPDLHHVSQPRHRSRQDG